MSKLKDTEAFVAQELRKSLDQYIGQPNTQAARTNIKVAMEDQIRRLEDSGFLPRGERPEFRYEVDPLNPHSISVVPLNDAALRLLFRVKGS